MAVIACKWHPLTAMENAAKDGFSYDPGITIVPIKCTGAVTVASLLKLFAKGLDGVLVLGCAEGDCHYYNGGDRCEAIVEETREILEMSGIPGSRLGFHRIANSTSSEFEGALKSYLKQFKPGKAATAGRAAKTGGKRVASGSGR